MKTVRYVVPLLVLLAAAAPSPAQPQLNFKRIYCNWPMVELYFTVACNGIPEWALDRSHFRVVENGSEVTQFDLWCPDPTVQQKVSVAMVFDGSSNAAGGGNAGEKAFGNAMVDLMDGAVDQAAAVFYGTTAWVQQGMATSKDLLHSAVNALPASGATSMWDGMYLGVEEAANNGTNTARAVVVVAAGKDTRSTHQASEVVAWANRNRLRVYAVGYGPWVDSTGLQSVASLTGGEYYGVSSASGLVALASTIMTRIRTVLGYECMITYDARCADGSLRVVDLTVQNYCAGSDTKTKTYKPPRDSTTFTPLRLGLGSVAARGDTDVAVPLQLLDTIGAPTLFRQFVCTVLFDSTRVAFKDAAAPAGTLLAGVPFQVTPVPGGISIRSFENRTVQASQVPAPLAQLTFTTAPAHASDTLRSALRFAGWTFLAGCYDPRLFDGRIDITPPQPEMLLDAQAPTALGWDPVAKDYVPGPFTVAAAATNAGQLPALNTRFTIMINAGDLQLVSPASPSQQGTPADVQPLGTSRAQWQLRAIPRLTADSVRIRIVATFDNHATLERELALFVPAVGPLLACTIQAENVGVHPRYQRLEPMPFTAAATVRNAGGAGVDNVSATIVLPPGLALAPPDAPSGFLKTIGTGILFPAQTGNANWRLSAPGLENDAMYTVRLVARSTQADSCSCTAQLTVPGLGPLRPRLAADADTIDFGSVVPGSTADAALGLESTGARTLHLSGAAIAGADAAEFSITAPPPDSLQPAATGSIQLRFSPASVGGKTALLAFTTDDPARAAVTVVLLGHGRPAPRLTVNQVLDFGTVAIGDTRDTTLDLRNTGLGALDLASQTIGGGDAAMFRLVIPAATPVAQGGFSRMTLRFLPASDGPKTSNLTLVSNDTVNPVQIVTLTGNGTTVSTGDPAALPGAPELIAGHPNPFAAFTDFAFTLPAAAEARVAVVDALGREVALLHEGMAPAGATPLRFEASRLPDGLYFAVLRAGGRLRTLPMVKAGK